MKFSKFLKAMIIPLLLSNIIFYSVYYISTVLPEGRHSSNGLVGILSEYVGVGAYFIIFGLLASYIIVVLIAWPLYVLGSRQKNINIVTIVTTAIILAVVPLTMFINGFAIDEYLIKGKLGMILTLAFCGFVAGALFWYAHRKFEAFSEKNSQNQRDTHLR